MLDGFWQRMIPVALEIYSRIVGSREGIVPIPVLTLNSAVQLPLESHLWWRHRETCEPLGEVTRAPYPARFGDIKKALVTDTGTNSINLWLILPFSQLFGLAEFPQHGIGLSVFPASSDSNLREDIHLSLSHLSAQSSLTSEDCTGESCRNSVQVRPGKAQSIKAGVYRCTFPAQRENLQIPS